MKLNVMFSSELLFRTGRNYKNVFLPCLLGAQHQRESVEKNPASSLISLGKAFDLYLSYLHGRQVAGQCCLLVALARSDYRRANGTLIAMLE